jgi:hypothetical protein
VNDDILERITWSKHEPPRQGEIAVA